MWSWFVCRSSWIQWRSQPLGVGGRETYCDSVTINCFILFPIFVLSALVLNSFSHYWTLEKTDFLVLILLCFSSHVSHLLFYFLVQGYDEEDGETDEAWNQMNGALCALVPFLCADFFSHLTGNFYTTTLTPWDWLKALSLICLFSYLFSVVYS